MSKTAVVLRGVVMEVTCCDFSGKWSITDTCGFWCREGQEIKCAGMVEWVQGVG